MERWRYSRFVEVATGAFAVAIGVAFAVLALIFAFGGRWLMRRKDWDHSEAPDLNERGKRLVGSMAVLTQPIAGGRGRAKIGDTTWRVTGPDLPEGARVRVVGAAAETLEVEAAGE